MENKKKTGQFLPRVGVLALILCYLFAYQQKARGWEQAVRANDAAIAEAEAYNREILEQQQLLENAIAAARQQLDSSEEGPAEGEGADAAAEPETVDTRTLWEDGEWTGTGEGFGGAITVSVTTLEDTITEITILSAADEDESYFAIALEITDRILAAQSPEVDTISGATFSSTGIRAAVRDALQQAEVKQ